jgi:hypothetical protein
VCGLRMFAAKNSKKRSEARSPAAAISAGTVSGGCRLMVRVFGWWHLAAGLPSGGPPR